MQKKLFLCVANWKMSMSFDQAISFVKKNMVALDSMAKSANATIILCPSFPALAPLVALTRGSSIAIGAQNCSEHQGGAYTGEVDSLSLAELGCSYCIVGHSERRILFNETSKQIACKVTQLIRNGIKPIICIGETKKEYENKATFHVLENQLDPIFQVLRTLAEYRLAVTIAYEPAWSIGTGILPEIDYLKTIFTWLTNYIQQELLQTKSVRLLYGGSINESSAKKICLVKNIGGFLIGGASLDFQKFEKIVLLENVM